MLPDQAATRFGSEVGTNREMFTDSPSSMRFMQFSRAVTHET